MIWSLQSVSKTPPTVRRASAVLLPRHPGPEAPRRATAAAAAWRQRPHLRKAQEMLCKMMHKQ